MSHVSEEEKQVYKLFKLADASQYKRWQGCLQDIIFKKTLIPDMDKLTVADTLDVAFFAKYWTEDFRRAAAGDKEDLLPKTRYQKRLRDAKEKDPFLDKPFLAKCLAYALDYGDGFMPWVADIFSIVRFGLSDEIQEKTSGIRRGDIIGLLSEVKLAICHFELVDPESLDIEFTASSMAVDGKNDLLVFTSHLHQCMQRLAAVGHPISDKKAQRVLLRGLDQEIFAAFIQGVDETPKKSYLELETALKRFAAKPHTMAKLKALVPGKEHSLNVNQEIPLRKSPHTLRMDRLEEMIATQFQAANPPKQVNYKMACKFYKAGQCTKGTSCRFAHDNGDQGAPKRQKSGSQPTKWCDFHKISTHDTTECRAKQSSTTSKETIKANFQEQYEYMFMLANNPPIQPVIGEKGRRNDWCVDGASTTHATWNQAICKNIRSCEVKVSGHNINGAALKCTLMGEVELRVINPKTKQEHNVLLQNVLIHDSFPCNFFSEIVAFAKGCSATKTQPLWEFTKQSGEWLLSAEQHTSSSTGMDKLYYVCIAPGARAQVCTVQEIDSSKPCGQSESKCTGSNVPDAFSQVRTTDDEPTEISCDMIRGEGLTRSELAKLSTKKTVQLLVALHLMHAHRNYADLAAQYGVVLPSDMPECWACLMAKARSIVHDRVSHNRTCSRPYEGLAIDWKGPIPTKTPEGYTIFFVIVCLWSTRFWTILAKCPSDWFDIWTLFVTRLEAKRGSTRVVAFIIHDNAKVFTDRRVQELNKQRGIEMTLISPHNQWQNPAERAIQTVTQAGNANGIHGGGDVLEWLWGWSVLHGTDAINRTHPSKPPPNCEGMSRLRICNPTIQNELRTLKPFLCLAMKTVPKALRGAFQPRAEVCVYLRYVPARKAYALLMLGKPGMHVSYSIDVKFITHVFPLRDRASPQYGLRASEAGSFELRSPGANRLVPMQEGNNSKEDQEDRVVSIPTRSSARGYMPSTQSLLNIPDKASIHTFLSTQVYTADQLAARTPERASLAINGPDSLYWIPSMLKDFKTVRDKKCVTNVTEIKPIGVRPIPIEQRFRIKYRGTEPIALADLPATSWKTRTLLRGDRMKFGIHYDETAAPVVYTPSLKMLIAWGVELGLHFFQWDQEAAFYGHPLDGKRKITVQLPPGYDPDATGLRDPGMPPLYGTLEAALPGIPQGSLVHYRELSASLKAIGFGPVAADTCLFRHSKVTAATSIHVDDGVLAAPSLEFATNFFKQLSTARSKSFVFTWGPLKATLGIDFQVVHTVNTRLVFLSQATYARTILERAGMLESRSTRTPAVAGRRYTKEDSPKSEEQLLSLKAQGLTQKDYHSLAMALVFLMCQTREDYRFVMGKITKFTANPGEEHWKTLKHALRYLKGTLDYGIEFKWTAQDAKPVDGPIVLEGWSDSSYSDDVDTGRSTIGFVFKAGTGVIAALSKVAPRVDSCVNHSELRAFEATDVEVKITDGMNQSFERTGRTATWLRGVKAGLEQRESSSLAPTKIFVDNSGVLSMLADVTLKSANKHIFRSLAENRERVNEDKSVIPVKINTEYNIANCMTKQEHDTEGAIKQLLQLAAPISSPGFVKGVVSAPVV